MCEKNVHLMECERLYLCVYFCMTMNYKVFFILYMLAQSLALFFVVERTNYIINNKKTFNDRSIERLVF